jgi:uncharacterized membrane protein YkvA (DUF1232 family)
MTTDPRTDSALGELYGLGRHVLRLLMDPRVPRWQKAIPVLAFAYVLSPVDLVPDVVPGLAQIDDLAVLVIALRVFLSLASKAPRADSAQASAAKTIDASYRVRES